MTDLPGYERPSVDGELCEDWPVYVWGADGRPELVAHSAKEMLSGFQAFDGLGDAPDGTYVCDLCDHQFPDMDGWVHTYCSSTCRGCQK